MWEPWCRGLFKPVCPQHPCYFIYKCMFDTQREGPVKAQEEIGHLQARERRLGRDESCWHIILDFWTPELWENPFLSFKQKKKKMFNPGNLKEATSPIGGCDNGAMLPHTHTHTCIYTHTLYTMSALPGSELCLNQHSALRLGDAPSHRAFY